MNVQFLNLVVARDWAWIQDKLNLTLCEDIRGIVAVDMDKQEHLAAIVLTGWTGNTVTSHVAITNPIVLKYGLIEEFKRYVFVDCGVKIVIGLVASDNEKALKFDAHIGFREVHRITDGMADGVDIVIMELRDGWQQQGRKGRRRWKSPRLYGVSEAAS